MTMSSLKQNIFLISLVVILSGCGGGNTMAEDSNDLKMTAAATIKMLPDEIKDPETGEVHLVPSGVAEGPETADSSAAMEPKL